MSSSTDKTKFFSTDRFATYKQDGKRIVMCTAYNVWQARLAEAAGVDAILVGDSLSMTELGHDTTLPVTTEDILRATSSVVRGAPHSYVIADMPFMSYQASYTDGMNNAGRMLAEGGAAAVKLEGASVDTLTLIEGLSAAGIPVIGHLGLTPQSINAFGGYKLQAKERDTIAELFSDTHLLMDAGAVALVLECIPSEVARQMSEMFAIPTIGIGAGPFCDGEVQVFHDLLGLAGDFKPKHAKRFIEGGELLGDALGEYVQAVRANKFPDEEQTNHIKRKVVEEATADFVQQILESVDLEDDEFESDGDGEDDTGFQGHFGGDFRAHLN